MALFVLGAILLSNYIYERHWDRGLYLDFMFSAREAFEGDKLHLSEELSNSKMLPLPWLLVKFQLSKNLKFSHSADPSASDKYYQFDLFSLMGYKRVRRKHYFTCQKRGYYKIRRIDLVCSNLLHTKNYAKQIDCVSELTVFPKPLEHNELLSDIELKNLDALILSNSISNPDVFEFKGIRDYMPTDSLCFVNFKASAVSQRLMVNVHAPTSSRRLEIVLNLEPEEPAADPEDYEQAIRLAATIAKRYIGEGVNVGLITNGLDVSTARPITVFGGSSAAHLYKIYEALARTAVPLVCPPFAPQLESICGGEAVYLLISPHQGDELAYVVESLKARGVDIYSYT